MIYTPSPRAEIITRRTYARPIPEEDRFETWEEIVARVISHQRWLWERAAGTLPSGADSELDLLQSLLLQRKASVAGRTLWLGGTETAKRRESSNFNCAFLRIETVNDAVDALWLLLQGCGVGFRPVIGNLSGFTSYIDTISVVRSVRSEKGGKETNEEVWNPDDKVWRLKVGDSAEAWAKALGKILAHKKPTKELILDFSNLRPAGTRLAGYGWISNGDNAITHSFREICAILNRRAGQLLKTLDILDIINHLGMMLSSRRAAEAALVKYGSPDWAAFAAAKKDYFNNNPQRSQSNNSLVFYETPARKQLEEIFALMQECGGSEPGFVNAMEAVRRAPYFSGKNPCFEILLPNKGFCNLVEVDVGKFGHSFAELEMAVWLLARANYRQTLVNLNDGILQSSWDQNNQYLRLCGVGLTGIARRPDLSAYDYRRIRNSAVLGAYAMADELGLQRPKNVTTIKPSGTLSKIMDTTEGIHKPIGRHIFNNVNFNVNDPILMELEDAGYRVFENPNDSNSMIVTFPVEWKDIPFTWKDGKWVNTETAVDQLERYKMLMGSYVDHNASITVSYSPDEVPTIIDWLEKNWDSYVAVSFLHRLDPSKTAKDLGHLYLPQEVVTPDQFASYASGLRPVRLSERDGGGDLDLEADCASGACPVR